MHSHKQIYTKKQIAEVLHKIKECVRQNRYTISLNKHRKENSEFINEYNIRSMKQKEIFAQLHVEDFCYTLHNTKSGFEDEILYVFVPTIQVYNAHGKSEHVDVYMKFNLIETATYMQLIVVSFHRRNKPVCYAL